MQKWEMCGCNVSIFSQAASLYSQPKPQSQLSQFAWSYRSATGQEYIIGLYHGPESGHLVVYCNNEVIAIDFNVKDNARYPFFIEEDLCEVRIERKADKFQYFFESNREVDTPFNRERQARDRHSRRFLNIALSIFGVIVVAASILIAVSRKQAMDDALKQLAEYDGEETIAKAYLKQDKKGRRWIVFSYAGGGQVQHGRVALPPHGILPNGMPLEPGDGFTVRYHHMRPEVGIMDFGRPAPELLERYRQQALREQLRLHPELSNEKAACQVKIAYDLKGIGGYADFFWQSAGPETNPDHNRNTYLRLVRDAPFTRMEKEQCIY